MAAPIKLVEPSQNEQVADLESKTKKEAESKLKKKEEVRSNF